MSYCLGDWPYMLAMAYAEARRSGHKMYVYGYRLPNGSWFYAVSPVKPS